MPAWLSSLLISILNSVGQAALPAIIGYLQNLVTVLEADSGNLYTSLSAAIASVVAELKKL